MDLSRLLNFVQIIYLYHQAIFMKSLYTICYVSKTAPELKEQDIEELFNYTSKANNKNGVSGILLHSLGNFFQVLEGDEKHLLPLFEKIKEDPRHAEMYEVYNKRTTQPVFDNYKSTFDIVKNSDDLKTLITYLNLDKSNSTNHKLKRLLKPFDMLGEF
jgi:hypothetical protein